MYTICHGLILSVVMYNAFTKSKYRFEGLNIQGLYTSVAKCRYQKCNKAPLSLMWKCKRKRMKLINTVRKTIPKTYKKCYNWNRNLYNQFSF